MVIGLTIRTICSEFQAVRLLTFFALALLPFFTFSRDGRISSRESLTKMLRCHAVDDPDRRVQRCNVNVPNEPFVRSDDLFTVARSMNAAKPVAEVKPVNRRFQVVEHTLSDDPVRLLKLVRGKRLLLQIVQYPVKFWMLELDVGKDDFGQGDLVTHRLAFFTPTGWTAPITNVRPDTFNEHFLTDFRIVPIHHIDAELVNHANAEIQSGLAHMGELLGLCSVVLVVRDDDLVRLFLRDRLTKRDFRLNNRRRPHGKLQCFQAG